MGEGRSPRPIAAAVRAAIDARIMRPAVLMIADQAQLPMPPLLASALCWKKDQRDDKKRSCELHEDLPLRTAQAQGCYTNRPAPQPPLPGFHRRPTLASKLFFSARVLPCAEADAFIGRRVIPATACGASSPSCTAHDRDCNLPGLQLGGDLVMSDLGALLWPRTVALVGASADGESLRGRIFNVMRGHAFGGELYPVSRSNRDVLGLKAYPSVADLPRPADLAVIIIPAKHVAEELERCGNAGVKSAVVLSSGFAESVGAEGGQMQAEVRAIAQRYGMAVMGPNSEGFANIAANLCATFSPAMEAGGRALLPVGRPRPQLAVCAQSGGMGFAFFDHGRAKELAFRYVVTTGNEACLETLDFADFILDEGKADALLLLLEDVKSPATFRRVAEKALKAGTPLIVNKIGQSEAGVRAAASHTAALAGEFAAYQAMFERYGLIQGRDLGEMVDTAAAFLAWGSRLPTGKRVGICTASGGGGGWMADACSAAGLDIPALDAETRRRIDAHLPAYGTSQNPVDATAQAVSKIGYAGLAGLVVPSPSVDGLIVVMTGRSPVHL